MSLINNGSLNSCLGVLNKSIKSKKKFCNVSFSKINLMFLLFLYKNGYIENLFVCEKSKLIKVKLKVYQDKFVLHAIKNYFKPGHKLFLNIKQISKLKESKKIETCYILWTKEGFITVAKAFYRRTGGLLICKIN